jgi:hypothetical protein
MPKVRLKPSLEHFEGTLYQLVFKLSPQGKPIVTKCPDMTNVEWSEAQTAQRQRFKQANEYAKAAMAEPDVRAIYEELAAIAHKHPYRMAFSDYFQGKDLLAKK